MQVDAEPAVGEDEKAGHLLRIGSKPEGLLDLGEPIELHDEIEVLVLTRLTIEQRIDAPAAVDREPQPVEPVEHVEDVGGSHG
jgi:hypothetical protein